MLSDCETCGPKGDWIEQDTIPDDTTREVVALMRMMPGHDLVRLFRCSTCSAVGAQAMASVSEVVTTWRPSDRG